MSNRREKRCGPGNWPRVYPWPHHMAVNVHQHLLRVDFPGGSAMQKPQEMQVWSLGQENLLEEGIATPATLLPGKSHGHRGLAGYSPRDRRVGHAPTVCQALYLIAEM